MRCLLLDLLDQAEFTAFLDLTYFPLLFFLPSSLFVHHHLFSIAAVESVQQSGKICILDIDVQGVQQVKKSSLKPRYVFIAPPSMDELERRLRGRGTEKEEQIQTRLGNAAKELEYGNVAGNFDRVFVNANLEECFATLVEAMKEWYPHLQAAGSTTATAANGKDGTIIVDDKDDTKTCTCLIS